MLVKHFWCNDGTLHHKNRFLEFEQKLSVDCCKSGPNINPTLRLNNFKHTNLQWTLAKDISKTILARKNTDRSITFRRIVYEKIPLAQMNQLKSTPHPGHDGISLSSITIPHSEQIFFMKRTNDINIKVSPVIIDTKKLIGMKRLMASMNRPKTNKMIPRLHFFKPEFSWGISE